MKNVDMKCNILKPHHIIKNILIVSSLQSGMKSLNVLRSLDNLADMQGTKLGAMSLEAESHVRSASA